MIHFQNQRLLFAFDMLTAKKKTPWSSKKLGRKSENLSYMLKRNNCDTSIFIIYLFAHPLLTPGILD